MICSFSPFVFAVWCCSQVVCACDIVNSVRWTCLLVSVLPRMSSRHGNRRVASSERWWLPWQSSRTSTLKTIENYFEDKQTYGGDGGGERSPDWHNQFLIQSFPGDFDSLSRPGCNSSVISINWIWFNFNEFMTVPMRQLKWRTPIRHVKKQLLQSNRLQNLLNWLIIILALMKHINVIMGSYVLCCIRQWLTHNFDASFLVWIPNSHEFSQNILLCVFYCCIRQITCLSVNLWISLFITKPWCETSVSFHF